MLVCIIVRSKLNVCGDGIATAYHVLVDGEGPCGLRSAIETHLLGAETVLVEARNDFIKNSIEKLCKFVIEDSKQLAFNSVLHPSIYQSSFEMKYI